MIDIFSLSSIALTFFILAVSPGPATLSNVIVAMNQGRKVGLVYGSGLACGLGFWGLIAASGMGVVLHSSVYLLSFLKILGGLYLLWLAFLSARSARHPSSEKSVASTGKNWFLQGLLLNLSNPKAVLAWMAALSVGLNANADVYSLTLATSVCIVVGLLVYVLYSFLFSIGSIMHAYRRFRRWIDGIVAGFFTLAGISLIRSSFAQQS
ncbi:MAG: LysE family transporter [Cyanobacteria bacterium J06631_12]